MLPQWDQRSVDESVCASFLREGGRPGGGCGEGRGTKRGAWGVLAARGAREHAPWRAWRARARAASTRRAAAAFLLL